MTLQRLASLFVETIKHNLINRVLFHHMTVTQELESLVRRLLLTTRSSISPALLFEVATDCVDVVVGSRSRASREAAAITIADCESALRVWTVGSGEAKATPPSSSVDALDSIRIASMGAAVLCLHNTFSCLKPEGEQQPGDHTISEGVDRLCHVWSDACMSVLAAQPPFPAEVCHQVAYTAAVLLYQTAECPAPVGKSIITAALRVLAPLIHERHEVSSPQLSLNASIELVGQYVLVLTSKKSSRNIADPFLEAIAESCLAFFSAATTATKGGASYSDDPSPSIPLVTRRIFIPALNHMQQLPEPSRLSGERFTARVHALLVELRNDKRVVADVVILMAALFDVIFKDSVSGSALDPQRDFRFHPLLWETLQCALTQSMSDVSDETAGRRATMQLQVTYLMKRIVDLTSKQSIACWNTAAANAVAKEASKKKQQTSKSGKHVDTKNQTAHHVDAAEGTVAPPLSGSSSLILREPVVFHPDYFVWDPRIGGSIDAWQEWFLVFETLNEYGVHINAPALAKVETKLMPLIFSESTDGDGGHRQMQKMHPCWLERLMSKALLHPNVGVRKLALRTLWKFPARCVRHFSSRFVCETVFRCAADVRLCTDLDRVVLPGNFLDCKVFEGREVFTLPKVVPLAEQLQNFYQFVVQDVVAQATFDVEAPSVVDDRAVGQVPAMQIVWSLLRNGTSKATRFTISTLIRVLWSLSGVMMELATPTTTPSTDAAPLEKLLPLHLLHQWMQCLKELVFDHHPYWLEARLNAMVLQTMLRFGVYVSRLSGVPITHVAGSHSNAFRRLIAMCSTCGETGGRAVAMIDACGTVGCVGAALSAQSAAAIMQHLAASLAASGDAIGGALLESLLDASGGAVAAWINIAAMGSDEHSAFDPMIAKEATLCVSQISPRDRQVQLWQQLITTTESLHGRMYLPATSLCQLTSLIVEYFRNGNSDQLVAATSESQAQCIVSFLVAYATRCIQSGIPAIRAVRDVQDFSVGEDKLTWLRLQTTDFDAIAAGVFAMLDILLAKCTRSDQQSATLTFAKEAVDAAEGLLRLITVIFEEYLGSQSTRLEGAANFGLLIVCRSAAKLLHSVLTPFMLDSQRQKILGDAMGSPDRCTRWMELVANHCCRLHLAVADAPTSLTGMSWGTVSAQYYRYLYNTVQACCVASEQLVRPNEDVSSPDAIREHQKLTVLAYHFATEQLDACSTSNLSSIYDILVWYSTQTRARGCSGDQLPASAADISRLLLARLDDTQRKEYFRCSAIAVYSLHCCEDHDYVKETLISCMDETLECERLAFFAASCVASRVLANPEAMWPVYKDVLLHAAVLYNSGREEEELEACVAVTEAPCTVVAPHLRSAAPPAVHLSSVGRALCISVILHVAATCPKFAFPLSMELIRWNTTHKMVSHEPCMPNSKAHRCRIRLWQLLCALLPTLQQGHGSDDASDVKVWQDLLDLLVQTTLPINNMGSVRRFMELYLIGIVLRNPRALCPKICDLLDDFSIRPQVCGSYALVAVHVLLQRQSTDQYIFDALFPRLMRLCASNQHLLRIISHIGVHQSYRKRRGDDPSWVSSPEVDAVFQFIDTAAESLKFRERHEEVVLFNPLVSLEPRQIFCIQRKEAQVWLKESIPAVSFDRIRFLHRELCSILGAVTPHEYLRSHTLVCSTFSTEPNGAIVTDILKDFSLIPHSRCCAATEDLYIDYTLEAMLAVGMDEIQTELDEALVAISSTDNMQRKVTSWWNSEVYNELHPRALGGAAKQSLIVVGTLLENPVNIAGLCRCGEIFTVEKIVVPDKKVFEHAHFVATARSAELWIPWEEVHPLQLVPYLQRMKVEGYSIVGIEQTATSTSMATYHFPERVVMVLGSEGQGIPASILPYIDVCVEIPQFGLIRSLNVHVTGAIVMYEYTKQHLMSKHEFGTQRLDQAALDD